MKQFFENNTFVLKWQSCDATIKMFSIFIFFNKLPDENHFSFENVFNWDAKQLKFFLI